MLTPFLVSSLSLTNLFIHVHTYLIFVIKPLGSLLFEVIIAEVPYGPGHAKTCLMPYANNKGADQPISTFVVRFLDIICLFAISKVLRF